MLSQADIVSEDSLKLRRADGKTPYMNTCFASPRPNNLTFDGLDSQESDGLVGHAFTRSFFEAGWCTALSLSKAELMLATAAS